MVRVCDKVRDKVEKLLYDRPSCLMIFLKKLFIVK